MAFTQDPSPDPAGKRRGREPKPREVRSQGYSIEQAVSDKAQLNTIAFSGLAFMTGTLGADTFLPPGRRHYYRMYNTDPSWPRWEGKKRISSLTWEILRWRKS